MKTITLDLDDFSIQNTNKFYLDKLRDQYPNFKASLFYIPADINYQNRLMPEMQEISKKDIRKAVEDGWLELIPHGLMHIFGECQNITYKDMEAMLDAYEEHFKELGVPYIKGFKAPNWLISAQAVEALNDHEWWLAVDRNQPYSLKTKKYYEYNWDIKDPFPKRLKTVKGHGHISGPSLNDFTQWMTNLSRIPSNYEWKFVSELMK